jgi:predicted dehydrogenase
VTAPEPFGVGVIGAGTISKQYLRNLTRFPDVAVLICADLDVARARAQAAANGVAAAGSPDDALGHPGVQLIVNLTTPAAHAAVTGAAIAAGKHVWSEKPLTLDVAAGRALLAAADAAGVRVGCAPDTVLGAGLQTARRLIDSGAIGTPLTALTLLQGPGATTAAPVPATGPGRGPAVRPRAVLPVRARDAVRPGAAGGRHRPQAG